MKLLDASGRRSTMNNIDGIKMEAVGLPDDFRIDLSTTEKTDVMIGVGDGIRISINGIRELLAKVEGISPARLTEILDAERDGRCWTLPVRPGDKAWLLLERGKGDFYIVESECASYNCIKPPSGICEWWEMYFDCSDVGNSIEFNRDDFGKIVFTTPEAAKAAEAAMREAVRGG
jgi:hypothetical protein